MPQPSPKPSPKPNLFSGAPAKAPEELTENLLDSPGLRIQRIVSQGHASPDGFWYDQDQSEWVAVLQGKAKLRFEGQEQPLEMGPGDFINIPAHQSHRLEWTSPDEPTIWLVAFYDV